MNDDEKQILDECLDVESGYTCWEIDFIESLDKSFRNRDLSDKQRDILVKLSDRI